MDNRITLIDVLQKKLQVVRQNLKYSQVGERSQKNKKLKKKQLHHSKLNSNRLLLTIHT